MNRTAILALIALATAGCGRQRTESRPTSGNGGLRTECYSVSLLPDTQLVPIDLDEAGRILVVYPANVIDFAFVWDGARHDLVNPVTGGLLGVYPSEMNDRGQVVGIAGIKNEDGGPIQNGGVFVWRDGEPTRVQLPVASVTPPDQMALAEPRINELGHVAGTFLHSDGSHHAFLTRGAISIDLGPGSARDLDDSDHVVGDSAGRAVMWTGTTKTDLGITVSPEGGSLLGERSAMRINNRMQVAVAGTTQPFLWSSGAISELGSTAGSVRGINDRGDVTGVTDQHVLWRAGATIALGENVRAGGLNERGQATGFDSSLDAPYVLDGSTRVMLPRPPGDPGRIGATLINNAGVVVGPGGSAYDERVIVWAPDRCPNGETPPDAGPPPDDNEPPPEEPTEE